MEEGEDVFEASAFGAIEVECDSVNFTLGENFSSYEQLKEKICAYKDGNSVQLVYNDSRTLEAAKKGAKKSKQGKEGVSLLFFTPYVLVWRQNVPQ